MLERKVSVIIPVYNGESVIEEAIRSALGLSCVAEVICVNDGSTDGTRDVVESINDDRVRLLNVENGGPAKARNLGGKCASSQYLAFLDADDIFMPRRFDKQLIEMIDGGYRASISSVIVATMDNVVLKIFKKSRYAKLSPVMKRLAVYAQFLIMNTPTLIVRKDLFEEVGGFDINLKLREDHKLLIDILQKEDIYIEPTSPVVRRMFDQSSTSNLTIDRLIDGNERFLSSVSASYLEIFAAKLSLFHVCFRRFGLFKSVIAKKSFFGVLFFYPIYVAFKVVL